MKNGNDKYEPSTDLALNSADVLRKQAENKFKNLDYPAIESLNPEEIQALIHELRVHQIELEIQNEELQRAQEELETSRARYVDLYDFAPMGYMTVSETGLISEVNLTTTTLLGVTRSALITQPLTRFILPEDQDIYYRHRKQLFETHQPQICELRLMRMDNPPFWARLEATTAQDSENDPVSCRIAISDITERKQAETDREILQAQLIQSQKMESVGRLAGGVAHDFNNMLGVILGNVEFLLDEVDCASPLHEDLMEIRKATERSTDLTRKLLAFARKQPMAPEVIDLNETVKGMLKMLRRIIGEDIECVWLSGEDLWPVKMDPSQIDQILANLCVNARDAITDVGKITIETAPTTFDKEYCGKNPECVPGEYIMLAVDDNGCGMDKETMSKLFEPFFTTKEAGKGTGLGLATIYGIVKQNNGFIDVHSEPHHGTCFRIYLPRYMGAIEPIPKKELAPPSTTQGHETILLVEDEPAFLKMTATMLKHLGYTVISAATPIEAIHLSETYAGDIHLLMTDVVMPEMNGRDLAKRLLSLYPNLKCLFMSGYTANIINYQGTLEAGVNFIQKPFSKQALEISLIKALEKVSSSRP